MSSASRRARGLARKLQMVPNVRQSTIKLDMPNAWSREEVEATVADYFAMLDKDCAVSHTTKRNTTGIFQDLLPGRSRGAIEKKHQNLSAVLIEMGYPYIDGYKPLGNTRNCWGL